MGRSFVKKGRHKRGWVRSKEILAGASSRCMFAQTFTPLKSIATLVSVQLASEAR